MKSFLNVQSVPLLEAHGRMSLHYLTGHTLEWFLRAIGRPLFYLVVINFALFILAQLPILSGIYRDVLVPSVFLIELAIYGWLGWHIAHEARTKTLVTSMKIYTAALSGGLLGFILGVILTLFQIFWIRELWTFFAIITNPMVHAIHGLAIAGVVGALTVAVHKNDSK